MKLYWDNGQVEEKLFNHMGFFKQKTAGSLFRAGGAPCPGSGRLLHRLPSHCPQVPQLQGDPLWQARQCLSLKLRSFFRVLFYVETPINEAVSLNCYCTMCNSLNQENHDLIYSFLNMGRRNWFLYEIAKRSICFVYWFFPGKAHGQAVKIFVLRQ